MDANQGLTVRDKDFSKDVLITIQEVVEDSCNFFESDKFTN